VVVVEKTSLSPNRGLNVSLKCHYNKQWYRSFRTVKPDATEWPETLESNEFAKVYNYVSLPAIEMRSKAYLALLRYLCVPSRVQRLLHGLLLS